jgi:hypothetical protein
LSDKKFGNANATSTIKRQTRRKKESSEYNDYYPKNGSDNWNSSKKKV